METTPQAEMPRYKCHKEVHALKIVAVKRAVGPENEEDDGTRILVTEGSAPGMIPISAEFVHKHNPRPGGYYVVYEDGYASFSPAKAFEEGYTRI